MIVSKKVRAKLAKQSNADNTPQNEDYIVVTPESDDEEINAPCSNGSDEPGCSYTYTGNGIEDMGLGCSNSSIMPVNMIVGQKQGIHNNSQQQQSLVTTAHPSAFELQQFLNLQMPTFQQRNCLLNLMAAKLGLKMSAIL